MKIFLQETPEGRNSSSSVRAIPFWTGGGHDSFTKTINLQAYERAYEKVYAPVLEYLVKTGEKVRYRGVNVLWCYKIQLFEYLHFSLMKYLSAVALAEREGASEVKYGRYEADFAEPFLFQILAGGDFKLKIPFTPADDQGGGPVSPKLKSAQNADAKAALAPKEWNWQSRSVLLFGDFARFEETLGAVGSQRAGVYMPASAPRIFWQCLKEGYAYAHCGAVASQAHQAQASKIMDELKTPPVQALEIDGIRMERLLWQKLEFIGESLLPGLLAQIDEMHAFLSSKQRAESCLLDEDISAIKNAFCQIAPSYKIKTFVMCHGALGGKIGFLPLTADYIIAWGRESKKKLEAWGCPSSKIKIAGCAWHEKYRRMDRLLCRRQIAKQYALDPGKPIIVLAPHARRVPGFIYDALMQDTVEWALRAITRVKGLQYIIKIHHGEILMPYYEKWFETRPKDLSARLVKKADPFLLARGADLLITQHSTYAIDGAAMSTPVVCLENELLRSPTEEWQPYGIFSSARSEEELVSFLENFKQNKLKTPAGAEAALKNCLNQDSQSAAPAGISKILLEAVHG